MVNGVSTLLSLPGSKPRHVKNDERHDTRHDKEKYTRTGERGVPRTAETWFVSRHYDPRTEVWRGGTPKVPKL